METRDETRNHMLTRTRPRAHPHTHTRCTCVCRGAAVGCVVWVPSGLYGEVCDTHLWVHHVSDYANVRAAYAGAVLKQTKVAAGGGTPLPPAACSRQPSVSPLGPRAKLRRSRLSRGRSRAACSRASL